MALPNGARAVTFSRNPHLFFPPQPMARNRPATKHLFRAQRAETRRCVDYPRASLLEHLDAAPG